MAAIARGADSKKCGAKKRGDQLGESGLYVTSARSSAVLGVAWKIAVVLAWLVALGILALTVAHWGWEWVGPAPGTIPGTISGSDGGRPGWGCKKVGGAAAGASVYRG